MTPLSEIRFVIITGLSGAGKSEAVRCFEDVGYFCVDNLPPALIPKFAELCEQSRGGVQRVALVIDVRGGRFFDALFDALEALAGRGIPFEILFLEASDEALVRRFKASRRRHPLEGGTTLESITAERARLQPLRARAERVLDTSELSSSQLRREIGRHFGPRQADRLNITVLSFGFKHGLPLDADLVFDVRFLPNPNYVAQLKPLTGMEPQVAEYVFKWPVAELFWQRLRDFIDFLLPHFAEEGKQQLLIAIGCTGGRHRSVAVAERLAAHLLRQGAEALSVEHRDAAKGERVLREAE